LIEVKNLTKIYGDHTAIKNLNFKIEKGKIYGLLGPNGAGKSTTMNIITGCLSATEGTVLINGHDILDDPIEAKRAIGYLPEIPPLYPDMTPYEYLTFVAEAKGVDYEKIHRQVRDVMELTQISEMRDRLIRNLSKGYKQRVGIAQAMLGNPQVIILDEPTVGLDPKQIIEIRDLIRRLGTVKTVVISSHILAEISAVCDHVVIISKGQVVADDTLANLESRVNRVSTLHLAVRGEKEAVISVITGIDGVLTYTLKQSSPPGITEMKLEIEQNLDLRDAIFLAMAEKKMPIVGMDYETHSLEDIFLQITERTSVEDAKIKKKKKKKTPFGEIEEENDEKEGSDE
jgi:ABC-2 type transport system ATP-binding protein